MPFSGTSSCKIRQAADLEALVRESRLQSIQRRLCIIYDVLRLPQALHTIPALRRQPTLTVRSPRTHQVQANPDNNVLQMSFGGEIPVDLGYKLGSHTSGETPAGTQWAPGVDAV